MRELVILGVLLLNLIIQSSILPFVEIFHVKPDTLSTLVVSFALLAGNPTGALVGFFGGLLQDILFGNNIGLHALQYMIVGYLIGALYGKLYIDKFIIPILAVLVGSIIKQSIMLGYNFFTQAGIPFNKALFEVIIPETLYTLIFMPLVFKLITKLYSNKFMKRKWRFTKTI